MTTHSINILARSSMGYGSRYNCLLVAARDRCHPSRKNPHWTSVRTREGTFPPWQQEYERDPSTSSQQVYTYEYCRLGSFVSVIMTMTTLRDDSGYSSSLAPKPSFRLVTVLSLCMLSLVCVVLAVMMIQSSNVNNDTSNTSTLLEMLYKLPLQLVIPSIVGGCVHWVALQLYLHN
jgi:hypothetical protein